MEWSPPSSILAWGWKILLVQTGCALVASREDGISTGTHEQKNGGKPARSSGLASCFLPQASVGWWLMAGAGLF
jgi:hypothetical protein